MRREERVTVQGPVKKQQPDGMSHRGGGGPKVCVPKMARPVFPTANFVFSHDGHFGLGRGGGGLGGGPPPLVVNDSKHALQSGAGGAYPQTEQHHQHPHDQHRAQQEVADVRLRLRWGGGVGVDRRVVVKRDPQTPAEETGEVPLVERSVLGRGSCSGEGRGALPDTPAKDRQPLPACGSAAGTPGVRSPGPMRHEVAHTPRGQ